MLNTGPAKKVIIYLNDRTRGKHGPLGNEIMRFLLERGVAAGSMLRPALGFGAHQRMHSDLYTDAPSDLPMRIEFTDNAEKVERLMPLIYDLVTDGVIEVLDVNVVKVAVQTKAAQAARLTERSEGPAQHLRIFLGEADRYEGEPLYDGIVKQLRLLDIAGATVHRGILGYGAKRHTHRDSLLHLKHDRPIMISVIDTAANIHKATAAVERMLTDGLLVVTDVRATRITQRSAPAEKADV
jgi:PII-like signaling protein